MKEDWKVIAVGRLDITATSSCEVSGVEARWIAGAMKQILDCHGKPLRVSTRSKRRWSKELS